MKASDLFVKCLENEGVEYIFGIPGEETLDLVDSLSRSNIKFVVTRHEQGAAFMADVYGRLTHKPGVCLSTLGPGATNLMTGVADAYLDRAPLVAITGQASLEKMHKEAHQYIDVVDTFKNITNWNRKITRPDFIPEIVRKAFDIACDIPGSVHIELPEDIAADETHKNPLQTKTYSHKSEHDENELIKAVELIKQSSRPVILAGNGVTREQSDRELAEFVDNVKIPVATTFMGKGTVPADDDLYIGSVGLQKKDYLMCGFDVADLVICVGVDPVEYSPRMWNPDGSKTIIHIHNKHPEIDSSYLPECSLIGNLKHSLYSLTKNCGFEKGMTDSVAKLKQIMDNELISYMDDTSFPLKPQKILHDIRTSFSRDDILISDVGAHKLWIGRLFPAYEPNTVQISNGLASMGFALPGAIAAKLVYPEKRVVAVAGDGGFMMNVQELETAKRLGCDLVVVIFNDSKYGVIEWNEIEKFKTSYGVDFSNPGFVQMAQSFGVNGVKIEATDELVPNLQNALEKGGIWVFDVEVDYKENIKLGEKLRDMICKL
ncbi:MAG: acetolactate synthase large subunit [Methanohalobium sp.]|uniref:acetolactate synthase large subunit n=1 Tax=Methanohalobium sp. TaxID=2837493 RepID=UPI00397D98A8